MSVDVSKILNKEWVEKLIPFLETEDFKEIINTLKGEKKAGHIIWPKTEDVFRSLNECSFNSLKVIICLQDPYPSFSSDGIAMSCSHQDKPQPSLRFVQDEIRRTVKDYTNPQPPDLKYLANQGVLLINKALTVRDKQSNSHQGLWDKFHNYLFYDVIGQKNHPLVYVIMGNDATFFIRFARFNDHIIKVKHPASAAYNGSVWDSQGLFPKVNEFLEKNQLTKINW